MRAGRQNNSGLALIELLVVAAIVTVITMFLSPVYTKSIEKNRELSDTSSMHLALVLGEAMHAEGSLALEPNQMFYDAETAKITEEIPEEGYGRGSIIDASGETLYQEENCGCNYDSTLSYRHAYLTIFYDETTRRVHAHWVGVAGAASREAVNVNRQKEKGDSTLSPFSNLSTVEGFDLWKMSVFYIKMLAFYYQCDKIYTYGVIAQPG